MSVLLLHGVCIEQRLINEVASFFSEFYNKDQRIH